MPDAGCRSRSTMCHMRTPQTPKNKPMQCIHPHGRECCMQRRHCRLAGPDLQVPKVHDEPGSRLGRVREAGGVAEGLRGWPAVDTYGSAWGRRRHAHRPSSLEAAHAKCQMPGSGVAVRPSDGQCPEPALPKVKCARIRERDRTYTCAPVCVRCVPCTRKRRNTKVRAAHATASRQGAGCAPG